MGALITLSMTSYGNALCMALLARLFSEKTQGTAIALASSLSSSAVAAKTLTFCNISVIVENIFLKREVYVHYPKSNPYDQARQFKMHFFSELCPLFRFILFNPLSSTRKRCSCLWYSSSVGPFPKLTKIAKHEQENTTRSNYGLDFFSQNRFIFFFLIYSQLYSLRVFQFLSRSDRQNNNFTVVTI